MSSGIVRRAFRRVVLLVGTLERHKGRVQTAMRYLPALLVLVLSLPASAQTVQEDALKAKLAASYSSCRTAAIYPTGDSVDRCKLDSERFIEAFHGVGQMPYDCSSISTYTGGIARCSDIIEAVTTSIQVMKAKTGQ